jgi:hypothetical protein
MKERRKLILLEEINEVKGLFLTQLTPLESKTRIETESNIRNEELYQLKLTSHYYGL